MDRRHFLSRGLALTGAVLLGCRERRPPALAPEVRGFEGEGDAPMGALLGEGETGRRFTDLSALNPGTGSVDRASFFVRTCAPRALTPASRWSIRLETPAGSARDLLLADLMPRSRPLGVVCMECAGNDPGGRFGLLSAGRWDGIPLGALVDPGARFVRIRGMDPGPGEEGISWIFRREDLEGAFLATTLEGEPLAPDNGGPVRLLVPGWYGCACIKWVSGIDQLDADVPASPHMLAYAGRTHQAGLPRLAGEFRPARMGLSAMPVRLVKEKTDGKVRWKLHGLAWGGGGEALQIQTGNMEWRDVESAPRQDSHGWSWWSYAWSPPAPGIYTVTLRPKDPAVRSIRLSEGYYARDCRIDET